MWPFLFISNHLQASGWELAKGALEARGLRVILASDDCGSMDPALGLATGGAKVYVEESCIEEARGILEGDFDGE